MESTPAQRTPRKRSRASALLALSVLFLFAVSTRMPAMETTAEKLGALLVPLCCLCAGAWYAWKDKDRGARIGAAVLCALFFGAFGFGVVKGMRQARTGQALDAELATIREGLAADADDVGPEAGRRHLERTRAAAGRLQSSGDGDAAAFGRVLETITTQTAPTEERLLAALEEVSLPRFLDIAALLADDDFEWQRATARGYADAAQACVRFHAGLPALLEGELERSGLDRRAQQQVLAGFQRTWPLSGRSYRAHVACARCYVELIDFLAEHRDGIAPQADGSVACDDAEVGTAYDALLERAQACETEVTAAVEALERAITRR